MSVDEICSLAEAVLPGGFCAFTLPVSLLNPRGVLASIGDGPSDFLALERGADSVVYVYDDDNDGIPESKRTLATENKLNHGLAIYDGYIYASSDRNVWRWPYSNFDSNLGDSELVVTNINRDGMGGAPDGHTTRTLVFDDIGRLYISIGSVGNVDPDSHRSRIRRFDITDDGGFPLDFQNGEVFADGLRNEVGMAFDKHGVLWGVENGADRLFRNDLGGDIHNDNPAEELNRFREEDAGKHWGYPYCWTEYYVPDSEQLGGEGLGTVWAWPSFLNEITDQECRDNYERSAIAMQAHSAPLGIEFYKWKPREELPAICDNDPFPERMDGYAFIAFHGSWNRDIPTGYKVVYMPFDANGDPIGDRPIDLLAHEPPNAKWDDDFRPVDVAFDECGRLIVSGDNSGSKIVRIQYNATNDPTTPNPTEMPTNPPTPIPTGTPTTTSTAQNATNFSATIPEGGSTTNNDPSPNPTSKNTDDPDDPCPCMPTNSPVTIPSSGSKRSISVLLFMSVVVAHLW